MTEQNDLQSNPSAIGLAQSSNGRTRSKKIKRINRKEYLTEQSKKKVITFAAI